MFGLFAGANTAPTVFVCMGKLKHGHCCALKTFKLEKCLLTRPHPLRKILNKGGPKEIPAILK